MKAWRSSRSGSRPGMARASAETETVVGSIAIRPRAVHSAVPLSTSHSALGSHHTPHCLAVIGVRHARSKSVVDSHPGQGPIFRCRAGRMPIRTSLSGQYRGDPPSRPLAVARTPQPWWTAVHRSTESALRRAEAGEIGWHTIGTDLPFLTAKRKHMSRRWQSDADEAAHKCG